MLGNRLWKILIGFVCMLLFCGVSAALATVPAEINYQGRLEDMTGPVNGTFTLMFRLFDGQTGGTPLWEEAQSVAVDQGLYNVILGTGTLNPLYGTLEDAVLGNDDLWFEVQVFGESDAMSPRQKLTSVGFALRAGSVSDGAITTTMLATDAVTTEKLVDGAVTAAKVTGGFVPDLDADKLDGYDSASFAPSDHNHDGQYYSKTYVDALEDRIAALEAKLQYLAVVAGTVNGMPGPHVMITGANLHVRSGSGSTNGTINGRGNLIVGYNELRGSGDLRTGSHNLVTGSRQNYSSCGGLVAGYYSTISSIYASVSGGNNNIASGLYASVSGGSNNIASGLHASVSGGYRNESTGEFTIVSGGYYNESSGLYASVSGGYGNIASGPRASVSGGRNNESSGEYASVSGGNSNIASGPRASVSGGYANAASGNYASVSGGRYNAASGSYSFVGGGGGQVTTDGNTAFGHYSAILGGVKNIAGDPALANHNLGQYSSISGGHENQASGDYASVDGGNANIASGDYSNVSGGWANEASGDTSSISGGDNNHATNVFSSVMGGTGNTASGITSVVSAGSGNAASGNFSCVSGGQDRSVFGDYDWRAGAYFQDN